MIAAIVLSGGKSERMGRPKALLQFRGQSFLSTILAAIDSCSLKPVIIVAGHHFDVVAKAFPNQKVIFNPDYELGMSTSAKAGIGALPANVDGAVLFLVDHPLIDGETIRALIRQVKPGRIIVPVFAGRRGHAIVIAADLFPEVLGLPSDQGLNTVVKRNHDRVIEVVVGNAGVLRDIDTPEQLAELLAEEQ